MAWRAMDPLSAISGDSSSASESDSEGDVDSEEEVQKKEKSPARGTGVSQKKGAEKKGTKEIKKAELNYDALSRHGYSGGPSILHVPPPKQEVKSPSWSWGNGKRKNGEEETIEERELTREIANQNARKMATEALAEAANAKKQKRDAIAEQKALSFSQKEKRKRDLGQASRAKNYVEEEKRLLRDSGVYSGFDS